MKDTTFWPGAAQLSRLAKSYRPGADGTTFVETPIDQLTYPLSDRRRGGAPAGGLFSTARDMYLLGRMILNGGSYGGHRYLTPGAVALMTSNQIGDLPMSGPDLTYGYGLGWVVHRLHPPGDPTGAGYFRRRRCVQHPDGHRSGPQPDLRDDGPGTRRLGKLNVRRCARRVHPGGGGCRQALKPDHFGSPPRQGRGDSIRSKPQRQSLTPQERLLRFHRNIRSLTPFPASVGSLPPVAGG